ncbi:hypothetical protein [Kiloniella sp. b19]|uniref:hypothetical protein n=1 Tax=Kiloniella sp. GXU_MW_B19 TaxID=3141326 RepID=UPI0031E1AC9F
MNEHQSEEHFKNKIRLALQNLAEKRETASYRQLAIAAEIPGPQIIHKLTHLLEEILREDHEAGNWPSLAILAVSRTEPAIPRAGFFIFLREQLGLYSSKNDEGPDAEAFHAALLESLWNCLNQKP